MSAQKDKHHPQQLFSINNEGIPWEEASGAKKTVITCLLNGSVILSV